MRNKLLSLVAIFLVAIVMGAGCDKQEIPFCEIEENKELSECLVGARTAVTYWEKINETTIKPRSDRTIEVDEITVTTGTFTNFTSDGSISYQDDIINTQVKADAVVTPRGSDILTDGALETWTDANTLTNWTNLTLGAGSVLDREASVIHGGTYAAKLTNTGGGTPVILEQVHSSLTVGTTYNATYWARYNGSGNTNVLVFNDTMASATQIFKFHGASSPSWQTYTGSEEGDSDYQSNGTLDATYTQYTTDDFTIPANGQIALAIGAEGGPGVSIYLDDINLATPAVSTPAALVDMFDLTNPSDISRFTSSDTLLKLGTTGGTSTTFVDWSALGSYIFNSPTGNDIDLSLVNQTPSNSTGARQNELSFSGYKADGTEHELASIKSFHSGSGDDTRGLLQFLVNDGTGLTSAMSIPYDGNVGIGTDSPMGRFEVASSTDSYLIVATDGKVGIGTTTPDTQLHTTGGRAINRTAVIASVSTDNNSHYFGCDTVGADTITLQTADTTEGRIIIIKDEGGNAGAQTITIATEGAQTIDGSATATITTNYDSLTLVSDGTNWFIN